LDSKGIYGVKVTYRILEDAVSIRKHLQSSEVELLQKKLDNKKSCLITSLYSEIEEK